MKWKNNLTKKIVVRIPPSPTGNLHIGTARTALFNYLFAKQNNGKIVFRIEDTDKSRSKKEFEENIIMNLTWLGITYDNEIIRQSERTEKYKEALLTLIEKGVAYVSTEISKVDPELKVNVVRLKNPGKKIIFNDIIRGDIAFDTTELGDFVIAKSLTEPLYHLAVVFDDNEAGVTHVIRGEDHISNTPRQILIQEAFGYERPIYAHVPLILGKDRSKLSKRHGATALTHYKEQGFISEAIINYLALLGWNPGTEKEIFNIEELIREFDISKIQKGGAIFDEKKLRWINKEHMKSLPKEVVENEIKNRIEINIQGKTIPSGLVDVIKERIEVFSDIDTMIKEGELEYFFNKPKLEKIKINWKDDSIETTKIHLAKAIEILREDENIMEYAESVGKGSVLWPLRYSLSGKERSPDPISLIKILGKKESIDRINYAINILNS